jgi:hypothetical protein
MRSRTNFQGQPRVQLELPFSWPDRLSNGGKQAKANGGSNRQRPANDDDPFARARGYIPPIGVPAYRSGRANNSKNVE